MRELPADRPYPDLTLSIGSDNVLEILKFCLRCRSENKNGAIFIPLGPTYWVNNQGQFESTQPASIEQLHEILGKLSDSK